MSKPATAKQLRYLRALANQTGTTFAPPRTSSEASKAIKQMQNREVSPRHEIAADRESVARRHGASSGIDVNDGEIVGYGSSARWAKDNR